MISTSEKPEIAFFDLETTIPSRTGQGYAILEFGALLVCSQKLIELESYSTLVRPADLSLISSRSVQCNGITKDDVVSAPTFADIADKVYQLLHGRIWAGHNILRFDCVRIREAFAEINRPPPVPKATLDSLALLTQRFGRRAGDMKMASLATYFGLGQQTHRSLDDVRMNLEVLKYCATVLLLESSLPDIFTESSWASPSVTKIRHNNGKVSPEGTWSNSSKPSSSGGVENHVRPSHFNHINGEIHPMGSLASGSRGVPDLVGHDDATKNPSDMGSHRHVVERDYLPSDDNMEEVSGSTSRKFANATESEGLIRYSGIQIIPDLVGRINATENAFDMGLLRQEIETDHLPSDDSMEEVSRATSRESSNAVVSEGLFKCSDFLEPDEISSPSISVILAPFYRGTQKVHIMHQGVALNVCCKRLRVRFGVSTKFVDAAGHARLSFVVDASPSLCEILDISDGLAQKLSMDSGSNSEWRPVIARKPGFMNSPTIRLHLPTTAEGNTVRWATEIYRKESSATKRLNFNSFDVTELDSLLTPGSFVDAYFSLDTYDYQQNNAGIRLVAKKMVLHSC